MQYAVPPMYSADTGLVWAICIYGTSDAAEGILASDMYMDGTVMCQSTLDVIK